MKKVIFAVLAVVVLTVGVFVNPFSVNDAGERQVVQTIQGDLWVRFKPGLYFAGFWSSIETYPNNMTIQIADEKHKSPDADLHVLPHNGTFSEGDTAVLQHTAKWDLPSNEEDMIELHKDYTTPDNLMTTTLLQYQKQIASYSTQRMSSEAHYSGGGSQLNEYFQDQLRNGQVLLVTETKTRKLEDGTTKTYIEVQEQKDENGNIRRSVSDIQKYNINASFASIDEVSYDPRIYEKLKAKIDAASDEATAKQQLITAQQEALTEKARGEKLVAQTKAREEALKLEAVIRAQKEAAVAEQNLKRDKLKAASELALKRAQAEGDKLKVAAGLTPLEKATIEKETAIGVAKALAGPEGIVFPKIVAGGSSGNGGDGALQTFQLKLLNDLAKDMSSKR